MAKKTETITLYISELLYDVKNRSYLTGLSRKNGDNFEEVANMQASDDDEHENQLLRSISNSFDRLKTKLSEYVVSSQTTSNNALMSKTGTIGFELVMPSNYNQATLDTITSECTQYIENMTLADWFRITNKPDYPEYETNAGDNLLHIREALNKRVRPVRPVI